MLTPIDRMYIVNEALTSEKSRGRILRCGRTYDFTVFPSSTKASNKNTNICHTLTTELANVIYNMTPAYRSISLGFYHALCHQVGFNPDVRIVVKGSNAYAYLTNSEKFPFSDLDVSIFINPDLDSDRFDSLWKWLHIKVLQTLSGFKRTLDDTFFGTCKCHFLDAETTAGFKCDYNKNCSAISPFSGTKERSMCSSNSFLVLKSLKQVGKIVKVEVPHFESCETTPLRRTPFVCSCNETIDFKRDGKDLDGVFNLYRIKLHNVLMSSNTRKTAWSHVAADFIDVTLSSQTDAELRSFWDHGRCLTIYDRYINTWPVWRTRPFRHFAILIPDLKTCLDELEKMLNLYICPEDKRAKRIERLRDLQSVNL